MPFGTRKSSEWSTGTPSNGVLMTEAEYFKERVEEQIAWYDLHSRWYKLFTLTLRIIEISAAAAIPFLATLTRSQNGVIASSVLGVIIVLCTSLASLFHAQE